MAIGEYGIDVVGGDDFIARPCCSFYSGALKRIGNRHEIIVCFWTEPSIRL